MCILLAHPLAHFDIDETKADINSKLTFQPMLAKNTNTIFMNSKFNQYSDSTNKIVNVHNRSQKWIENKNVKLRREKEFMNREVEKELTFRPSVSKRLPLAASAVADASRSMAYQCTDDTTSIMARNISWMRKREERLQIERKRKENEELVGCTFAPQISHKTSSKTTRKNIGNNSTNAVENRNSLIPSQKALETVFSSAISTYDSLNEEDFLREYKSFLTNLGQV